MLKLHPLLCFQLNDWLGEKMIAAQDETYRDAKSIHSKWMRHQAFEAEIKANKDRLEHLIKDASELIEQKPELASVSHCYRVLIACTLMLSLTLLILSPFFRARTGRTFSP